MRTTGTEMEGERAAVPVARARPTPRSDDAGPDGRSQSSSPRLWALVQVWNGAVLATFDDDARARKAMDGFDDDEVVVLSVRS